MLNIFFELDRLRVSLENKGLDSDTVERLIAKASQDIDYAFEQQGTSAMELAVEAGVSKRSEDFINDLQLDRSRMTLSTMSGNMDFSEPPYPMLDRLLQNAKPIKDGSGVYKVIPVGQPGKDRPRISSNIFDAQKQIMAMRAETAKSNLKAVSPRGSSKPEFRTATSKQSSATKWVQPAKEKDFTGEMHNINDQLATSMEDIVRTIIRDYEENF